MPLSERHLQYLRGEYPSESAPGVSERHLKMLRGESVDEPGPSTPGLGSRAWGVAQDAFNVVSAPVRALGVLGRGAQETVAGVAPEESRLPSDIWDYIKGAPTETIGSLSQAAQAKTPEYAMDTPASLAIEGYKTAATGLGAGEAIGERLDPTGRLAHQTEEERKAWEERHPVASRVKAAAEPLSELALTFATDPLLHGMGSLGKLAKTGRMVESGLKAGKGGFVADVPEVARAAERTIRMGRLAGAGERALGAAFVPMMAASGIEEAAAAKRAFGEEGFSPEAIRAGVTAAADLGLAGVGAFHAARPPSRTRDVAKHDIAAAGAAERHREGMPERPVDPERGDFRPWKDVMDWERAGRGGGETWAGPTEAERVRAKRPAGTAAEVLEGAPPSDLVSLENAYRVFGGKRKVSQGEDGTVAVDMGRGRKVYIGEAGEVSADPGALKRGYGTEALPAGQEITAFEKALGPDAVIGLAKGSDVKSLAHEQWHALEDLLQLSPKERKALEKLPLRKGEDGMVLSPEESRAEAFADYYDARMKGVGVTKVRPFDQAIELVRKIYRSYRPDARSVFERMIFERPDAAEYRGRRPAGGAEAAAEAIRREGRPAEAPEPQVAAEAPRAPEPEIPAEIAGWIERQRGTDLGERPAGPEDLVTGLREDIRRRREAPRPEPEAPQPPEYYVERAPETAIPAPEAETVRPPEIAAPEPVYAFRTRDVGEQGVPAVSHAQASLSEADVRRVAPSRTEAPQEVVRVDLSKLDPEFYEVIERPGAASWVRFKRELPEAVVERVGEIGEVDRAAASKAESLPEPQAEAIRETTDRVLGDPAEAARVAEKAGLSQEGAVKGAEDVKADALREFGPEAVAVKRAALAEAPAEATPGAAPEAFGPEAPARRQRGEFPKDEDGTPIYPQMADLPPSERKARMAAAWEWAKEVKDLTDALPPGRRKVSGLTVEEWQQRRYTGEPRDAVGAIEPGMRSHKAGTPLEGMPESPKQILEALKRDKNNALERRVLERMEDEPRTAELRDEIERYEGRPRGEEVIDREPEGPVDASFDPAQFEGAPSYSVRRAEPTVETVDLPTLKDFWREEVERGTGLRTVGVDRLWDRYANWARETGVEPSKAEFDSLLTYGAERGELSLQPHDRWRSLPEETLAKFVPGERGEAPGGLVRWLEGEPRYRVSEKAEDLSPLGLYSQLSRVVNDPKFPKAARGADYWKYLTDSKRRVKAEELYWTGVEDLLKAKAGQKVSREEIRQALQEGAVEVQEVARGAIERVSPEERARFEELSERRVMEGRDALSPSEWDEYNGLNRKITGRTETKFSDYQAPGGENYREVLLTLPAVEREASPISAPPGTQFIRRPREGMNLVGYDETGAVKSNFGGSITFEDIKAAYPDRNIVWVEEGSGLAKDLDAAAGGYRQAVAKTFFSSHWDEPNVLAHVRLNDRTDAQGKRTLFVDEIQSDWAQKGREEGFAEPSRFEGLQAKQWADNPSVWEVTDRSGRFVTNVTRSDGAVDAASAVAEATRRLAREPQKTASAGTPKAPYVTKTEHWVDLALKRILRMAAEEGYDQVAWTPGKMQAERYDLSKQIDRLIWSTADSGKTFQIVAERGGQEVMRKGGIGQQELAATVGKEVADKIVSGEGAHAPTPDGAVVGRLSPRDLKIGGEGMTAFYDRIVPQRLAKLTKRWGVKPEKAKVEIERGADAEETAFMREKGYLGEAEVPAIPITPQMRESVMAEGLPQYRMVETLREKLDKRRERNKRYATEKDVERVLGAAEAEGGRAEGKPPEALFNLNRQDLTDEGRAVFDREAEALRPGLEEAQGKKTWKESTREALRLLGKWTPKEVERATRNGWLQNRQGVVMVTKLVPELRENVQKARESLEGARKTGDQAAIDKAETDLTAAGASLANMLFAAKGQQAEAARALNIYRMMRKPRTPEEKAIDLIWKRKGGMSEDAMGSIMDASSKGPEALVAEIRKQIEPKLGDYALEWWKAGMLSGVPTQGANITGNVLKQAMSVAEVGVSGAIDRGLAKLEGRERERFATEAGASLAGMRAAGGRALKTLLGDLRDIALLREEKVDLETARKLEYVVGATPGKVGRGVRIPFRLLTSFDEFFKTIARESELYKQALRKAEKRRGEGIDVQAEAQRIVDEFNAARAEKTPDGRPAHKELRLFPDISQAMSETALRETFQNDPGKAAQIVAAAKSRFPILNAAVPFLNTPANIMWATLRRTPAGLAHAIYKGTKGDLKGGELSDALARGLVGTALMAAVAPIVKSGGMTGSGPTDYNERNLLRQTGWQPYSFVYEHDDGTRTYVPFSRFEPVSSLLGMMADAVETGEVDGSKDVLNKIGGSVLENLTSKTYLRGMTELTEALADPQRYFRTYVSNLAGSVVPTIVGKAAQVVDPTIRDTTPVEPGIMGAPEAIGKRILSRIPFASRTLPARYSGTGEVAERKGSGLARFVSPAVPSERAPGEGVEEGLVEAGYAPRAGRRELSIPGGRGRKVVLTEQEYGVLMAARRAAAQQLEQAMAHPRWDTLTQEQQQDYAQRIFRKANEQGRNMVYPLIARRLRAAPMEARIR